MNKYIIDMELEYEEYKYYFFFLYCFICHRLFMLGYYITDHIDDFYEYLLVVT